MTPDDAGAGEQRRRRARRSAAWCSSRRNMPRRLASCRRSIEAGRHAAVDPPRDQDAPGRDADAVRPRRGRRAGRSCCHRRPLAPLLAAARGVVTVNSTVAIDALHVGVPSIVLGLPNNLTPFVDAGAMLGATDAHGDRAALRSLETTRRRGRRSSSPDRCSRHRVLREPPLRRARPPSSPSRHPARHARTRLVRTRRYVVK